MTRWKWLAARSMPWRDHTGMTLLFLLALWLILHSVGLRPREVHLTQQAETLAMQEQTLQRLQQTANTSSQPEAQILPPVTRLSTELAILHELAGKSGLSFRQVDYEMQPEGRGYWRYHMRSEGEFSYPATQRFMGSAFSALPNLALDKLEIERDNVLNGTPKTKLALSLYYRDSLAAGGAR